VKRFDWDEDQKTVEIDIEDLCFNFEGFPEYKGPVAGRIVLEGVEDVAVELPCGGDPLRIDDFVSVKGDGEMCSLVGSFWPSGRFKVEYRRALHPDVP
jgi:hypothetical protein